MENANKALIMAASTLLAVMLFAVFMFFIKQLSIWPEAQDEMLSTEQRTAFNEEYEVYEKSLMYGVDVISCLNKAKSNNEKYEQGGANLSGDAFGSHYHIDVYVRLDDGKDATKSCLSESIEIYYYDQTSKKERQRLAGDGDITQIKLSNIFKGPFIDQEGYTLFRSTDYLKIVLINDLVDPEEYLVEDAGDYKLTKDGTEITGYYSLAKDKQLQNILKYSGENMKQTVKHNTDGMTQEEKQQALKEWSSAIWKTALYDFKTKRFTCDAINYNESTGLISEIWFSEK